MAWKTMDDREQRVRFVVEAAQHTRSFKALCAAYEISRPTGYLWLERYREQGVAGIAEQSRKPHRRVIGSPLAMRPRPCPACRRRPSVLMH